MSQCIYLHVNDGSVAVGSAGSDCKHNLLGIAAAMCVRANLTTGIDLMHIRKLLWEMDHHRSKQLRLCLQLALRACVLARLSA
jgi:hypothetical protein